MLRRDHPCAVAFLDESGAIARDQYFSVGVLKTPQPARMLRAVQKYRDQTHWYKEFKYTDITSSTVDLYRGLVDVCLRATDAKFFCFVADRALADPIERFGSPWAAYGKLAEQLVVAALRPGELVTVLADNYSTPDHVLFEEDLQASVNRRLERLAVTACCRLDSKSSDGLQVVDLLVSAVTQEFRAQTGAASSTSPKAVVAAHVRRALGTDTCLGGWRSRSHSVAMYEHGTWHAPPRVLDVTSAHT